MYTKYSEISVALLRDTVDLYAFVDEISWCTEYTRDV